MKKVLIRIVPPDAMWAKAAPEVKKGCVEYVAQFCKWIHSKVVHVGPTVSVYTVDEAGKEELVSSTSIKVSGEGIVSVMSMENADSPLEKGSK